jgi:HSP20 family molecular chaperone IbpA
MASRFSSLFYSGSSPHPQDLSDPFFRLVGQFIKEPQSLLDAKRMARHATSFPDFDLRETASAHFLDGELPGVQSITDIKLKWNDTRTLFVAGKIRRVDLAKEWGTGDGTIAENKEGGGPYKTEKGNEIAASGYHDGNETDGSQDNVPSIQTWLHERRTGP